MSVTALRDMRRTAALRALYTAAILLLAMAVGFGWAGKAQAADRTKLVYDEAELLSSAEEAELTELASRLGAERETAFIILTYNGTGGVDIVKVVEDFYDDQAPGYDKPHGNAAIIAIDLEVRDVYLAGFGKAETYLDDGRLDRIRGKITPALSEGEYAEAFTQFVKLSHRYMGYEPGVNPDNPLFRWWFQLAAALVVAGVVTGIMAYRSGGRVTVSASTYMNRERSKVLSKSDRFLHQTVTRRKIEKSSSGGGGGGGGITGGGRSHSGSRGKF